MRVCEKCAQRAAPSLVEFCCASRGTGRLASAIVLFRRRFLDLVVTRRCRAGQRDRGFQPKLHPLPFDRRDKARQTATAPGIGEIETFDVCWLLLVVSDCGNRDDRERDRSRGMRTRRGNCARARQFSRLNAI